VTVTPENVKLEYIRTYLPSEENGSHKNGEIAYTFTVNNTSTGSVDLTGPSTQETVTVHPNPFNTATHISYQLDDLAPVKLEVRDIKGRQVTSLVNRIQEPGFYTQTFDAARLGLPSGIYFGSLCEGEEIRKFRMVYSTR
jgi:hypothetical protein